MATTKVSCTYGPCLVPIPYFKQLCGVLQAPVVKVVQALQSLVELSLQFLEAADFWVAVKVGSTKKWGEEFFLQETSSITSNSLTAT